MLNDIHNQYLLIIELLRKEEEELTLKEDKFEKEKDELLEKIVSLNDRLAESQEEILRINY